MNEDLIRRARDAVKEIMEHQFTSTHPAMTSLQVLIDTAVEAADALEAMQSDIHSCHPGCARAGCVNERLRADVEALTEALANSGNRHIYTAPPGMVFVSSDTVAELKALRAEVEVLRANLGACAIAMRSAMNYGDHTDWTSMIAAIDAARSGETT